MLKLVAHEVSFRLWKVKAFAVHTHNIVIVLRDGTWHSLDPLFLRSSSQYAYYISIIEDEIKGACGTNGIEENNIGNGPLRRCIRKLDDNIKMDLKEILSEGVGWVHLVEERDEYRAVVNTVMNFLVSVNAGKFLASWRTITLSRSTPRHGVWRYFSTAKFETFILN